MTIARLLLLTAALAAGTVGPRQPAAAQADRNPVGWVFSPRSQADYATILSYDECATCSGETTLVRFNCMRDGQGSMMISFPNAATKAPRAVGRTLPFTLSANGVQLNASGRADDYQGALLIEVPVQAGAPLFGAMERGGSLSLTSPVGGYAINLQNGRRAISAWRAACTTQAAATGGGSFGTLQRYVGNPNWEGFLRDPAVAGPMAQMMPPPLLRQFRGTFQVVSPVQVQSGVLVLQGGMAHQMNRFAAILTVAPNGRIEAAMMTDERMQVFGVRTQAEFSPPLQAFLRENAQARLELR